jgi:hypothetical protein
MYCSALKSLSVGALPWRVMKPEGSAPKTFHKLRQEIFGMAFIDLAA